MRQPRLLVVTADDFGIGRETSRAILELGQAGLVTATVLIVNAPFAEESVAVWNRAGRPVELGWHPCLTLDRPVASVGRVRSLVDRNGDFFSLPTFLTRLALGQIRRQEIEFELRAQLKRFIDLVGFPPPVVNAHHHLHVFPPVGDALRGILTDANIRPFLRRVVEGRTTSNDVAGSVFKRRLLSRFGAQAARAARRDGLSGCETLIGMASPDAVRNPQFLTSLVESAVGRTVELTCHPGNADYDLAGRDEVLHRTLERDRLRDPAFREAVAAAGFRLAPASVLGRSAPGLAHPRAA